MINIISSDQNSIFYHIPSGKPDPNLEKLEGTDTRPRIKQKMGDDMCVIYALRLLSERYGKKNAEKFPKERAFEKICSEWKRENGSIPKHLILPEKIKLIANASAEFLKKGGEDPEKINFNYMKRKFTEDKCSHHPFNPIEIGTYFEKNYSSIMLKSGSLVVEKSLRHAAFLEMAKRLNFKESTWLPGETIESLIIALKDGPILVCGEIGPPYYADDPEKSTRKIGQHFLYYWKPNSKKVDQLDSHAVVVVGAEKEKNNERVFYVDPSLGSSPELPLPFFAVSYKNFKDNIRSVAGTPLKELKSLNSISFGLYNPKIFQTKN